MRQEGSMSDTEEEWRPVVGHDGYEVSSLGRVRSWIEPGRWGGRRATPLVRSPYRHPTGHQQVQLAGGRRPYVHQLVLEAFIGPCPEGMEGCHDDGDPSNNTPANLFWGTHAQNMADMDRHGTRRVGEAHHAAKLTEADVIEARHLRASAALSWDALARRYGVNFQVIKRAVRGRTWARIPGAVLSP